MPPELIVAGVGISVIVPAVVELLKRLGLATRWAGVVSIAVSGVVLGLVELREDPTFGGIAAWALLSIVYGLAATGLFSQVKTLSER